MKRHYFVLLVLMACVTSMPAQDKRLMTKEQYQGFLIELEQTVPKWEGMIERIDPEKLQGLTYAEGKRIDEQKLLLKSELAYIRVFIQKEKTRPKASQALFLGNALGSVFDGVGSIGDFVNWSKAASSKTWERSYNEITASFPEISGFRIRLGNHVQASVEALEDRACP